MDGKMWTALLAALVVLLLAANVCLVIYFIKRERRLAGQIQKMLDDAIAGKIQAGRLDESRISVIENSMWRYLCDHEAAMNASAKAKEQMQAQISDISHQAVIPIANIILYAQLLEEWVSDCEMDEKDELRSEIEAIQEQARALDFQIESLVKISRLEAGIINTTAEKQPLQPVLDAVKNQFQAMASQKEIQLEIGNSDESAVLDRKWTIEAVANIVDNALKYTPCGGRVTVSVTPYPSFVRLDVTDNGIGIPEEEQAKVFSRFYRSKRVSDRPGVGIGLYLAREVMKAQGGYIKLSSKINEGSTFSLFFVK